MASFDRVRLRTRAGAMALTVLLLTAALCGCQSVEGSSPSQTEVRVIDASYNAPSVDVNVGTTPIATNIGAATFTNYAFLPPENTTAYVFPTGSSKATASASGEFEVAQAHSVFITDTTNGSYSASILLDQAVAAPAGYFSIRFLQQALEAGAVDIYLVPSGSTLADSKPLFGDVAPQSAAGYANVMAGSYTIVITPAGSTKTPYSSSQITFVGGQVRTVLIMDAQLTTNPPVTVTIGNDLN
jgi:hypothetical protein